MSSSPFGSPFGTPAAGPDGTAMGPFETAALSRGPFDAPAEPAGAAESAFSPVPVPAPRPAAEPGAGAEVTEPAGLRARPSRPERPSPALPERLDAKAGSGGRRGPLLVLALGGGALVAGALAAAVLLGSSDDDAATTGTVVVAGAAATPGSGPTPSAVATTGPGGEAAPQPGSGSVALGRDPFAALVAPVGGTDATATDAVPDPAATDLPGTTTGGYEDPTGGSAGVLPGGSSSSSGGSADPAPVPQTTVTVTAPPSPSPSQTPLTTAQTCAAASGPLDAVERLLASGSAPVDTGTALRGPVTVLRATVGASGDAALASRLDVATSSAESLRSQLLGGVAVTDDQVATQTSLDDAVRAGCS